jgi:hypothetical protein
MRCSHIITLGVLSATAACASNSLSPVEPCDETMISTAGWVQQTGVGFVFLLPNRFVAEPPVSMDQIGQRFVSTADTLIYNRGSFTHVPLRLRASKVRTCEFIPRTNTLHISTGVVEDKYQVSATYWDMFGPGIHLVFFGTTTTREGQREMMTAIRSPRVP